MNKITFEPVCYHPELLSSLIVLNGLHLNLENLQIYTNELITYYLSSLSCLCTTTYDAFCKQTRVKSAITAQTKISDRNRYMTNQQVIINRQKHTQ